MYIWVILATFIAILYSFSLAPREDMRELYVAPRAEATISKLVIQHKAGMNWVLPIRRRKTVPRSLPIRPAKSWTVKTAINR